MPSKSLLLLHTRTLMLLLFIVFIIDCLALVLVNRLAELGSHRSVFTFLVNLIGKASAKAEILDWHRRFLQRLLDKKLGFTPIVLAHLI